MFYDFIFLQCDPFLHLSPLRPPAGLPGFIHEPEDLNVTRNANFTLTCVAKGPPEPVSIRWFSDEKPVEGKEEEKSPSRLTVEGKPHQHAVIFI